MGSTKHPQDRSPNGRRSSAASPPPRRLPRTPPVKIVSAFARSSNRDNRSDVFSTGPLDLVTDRVKNVYLGFSIILMFPVVMLNIVLVLQLSSVVNHWDNDLAAQMSIMRTPSDLFLGEKSETAIMVLVANAANIPVNGIVVRAAVESVVPDEDFMFCAESFVPGSSLYRRLNEVCSPLLDGSETSTDNAGFAEFTDLAVIAGVPGNYVLNVTAYNQEEGRNDVGQPIVIDTPLVSQLVYTHVYRNVDVRISTGQQAPDEVEYGKSFDNSGEVCVAPDDLGASICSSGSRPDLSPPSASFEYTGSGRLSSKTTMTFFLVAGFHEMLVNAESISFPRTRVPHQVGSQLRMADYVHGSSASTTYLVTVAETRFVQYPGFVIRGSNNPALFFAFYSCGVFKLWNQHTLLPNGVLEVQELAMIPPLDLNGLRAAQGEVWRGGSAFAEVGDDGVAAGDQSYLNEVLLTDYPTEVLEGAEFQLWMEIYTFRYPRGQRRPVYMPNVVAFAEAFPVDGIREASDAASYRKGQKVLLNAVSRVSTEGVAVFDNLAFSVEGDVGWYRIQVYAEGFFHVESFDIKVSSGINQVRLKLPAHLQMTYPGCDLTAFPSVDANGDGNPDYNASSGGRVQSICIPMIPFQKLVDNLPYLEAYSCDTERFLSTAQNCVPMQDKVLKVSAVAMKTTYNVRKDGSIRWTHTEVADNELEGVLSYEWQENSVAGRYDITSLVFNNAFHDKFYLTFSVGGIVSNDVIAVQLGEIDRVKTAVDFCEYAPVAYIDVLDKPDLPTVAYPSMSLQLRAFAADAVGEPAVGRVLCLGIFELDWHDTFADRVLQLELESKLVKERERAPWTVVENMTYYNKTCFLTGEDGVGTLDFYFDSLEMWFREGAFGWYVYSAEFDGGRYYLRTGTRFFLDHEWKAETEARACLSSVGYSMPAARSPAYFVHLRPHWTEKAPYVVLPTARHPRVPPEIGDSRYPQRSTWYGSLKTRWVTVGERTVVYFRLYEGTALTDELVYPLNVVMETHLLSGPEGFPIRLCAAGDLDSNCYSSADLAFTTQPRTDVDGYGFFTFQATTPGKYRFLLSVGTSISGGNFFSPVFEIENVPFTAANDCSEAQSLISSSSALLAPQMKYFHTCPVRESDGACSWTATVCDASEKHNLLLLEDVVVPSAPGSPPTCVPIGGPFPSRLALEVISDVGDLLSGSIIAIQGAPGSESVLVDPIVSPPTVGGNVSNIAITLNYADPGEHRLLYAFQTLSSSFPGNTIVSTPFLVSDELRASFLPWSQQYALHGQRFSQPVEVKLVLHRRCLFNVTDSQSRWTPPPVEIVMEPFDAVNGSVQRRATTTVVLEGAIAMPVETRSGEARASFPNLTVVAGLQGTYVLKVRVRGSSSLASSIPVQLVTDAASLLLVDVPPSSVDMSSTLYLRVRTTAANGVGLSMVYVHAMLRALNESNDDAAGVIADDPRNLTGTFVRGSNVALSDGDGVAHFALNIERAAPGEYSLGFSSPHAPMLWTRPITLIPSIQSVEIIAAPIISNIYSERPVIWPFLRAKAFDVNFTTMARHGPVFESPFSMKGIVVGADENDVILRVKDWRGIAVWGLEFDVTMVTADDMIVDTASSASRGVELTQDQGLRQVGPSCASMETIFDCHGLYAFPTLATSNDVKTGFYRYRFEVGGLAVTQPVDVLFRNYYLPNILYIDLYMLVSLASPILCAVLFQINRADKSIYNHHTAKYAQSAARRLFQSTIPTGLVGVFGVANYFFYLVSDQSKTPPYDPNGYLIMSDVIAKWSVLLLFGFVFGWLFRSLFGELKRGPNKILEMEHFVNKLGHSASIELLRRSFVGKVPKTVPKPPRPVPVTSITNRYLKRIDKVVKFIAKTIVGFFKLLRFLWHALKVLVKKIQKLYLLVKYSLPMFTSLYQGWPDVHFGQRMLSAIMLSFFVVASALTIGLWFGDRVKGMLTNYYSRYLEILSRHRTDQVDWAGELSSGAGLNSLEEVVVIFCARTAGRGQEFFNGLLNAVLSCAIAATVISTILFILSILKTMSHTRNELCQMRLGRYSVDPKKLTLTDACAFIGTQAVLVGFGWGVMFFTCFSIFFIMSWGPTRSVFLGTPLLLLIISGLMYGLSFVAARIRIRRNPGMVIVNRAQFAFAEFGWWLIHISVGPFVTAMRLIFAIFGQVGTWFWLWINAHEDVKGVGNLGNSMYTAATYVHNQHNNPIVRAVIERMHRELRNKDTLRLFPNTNTEPAVLLREKKALVAKREKRRTVAKLLVMMQMRANERWELAAQRKQALRRAAAEAAELSFEDEGDGSGHGGTRKSVRIREEAMMEDVEEDEMDVYFHDEEDEVDGEEEEEYDEMEHVETIDIEHPEMDEDEKPQPEGDGENERLTTAKKKLMAPPTTAEEEADEEIGKRS